MRIFTKTSMALASHCEDISAAVSSIVEKYTIPPEEHAPLFSALDNVRELDVLGEPISAAFRSGADGWDNEMGFCGAVGTLGDAVADLHNLYNIELKDYAPLNQAMKGLLAFMVAEIGYSLAMIN